MRGGGIGRRMGRLQPDAIMQDDYTSNRVESPDVLRKMPNTRQILAHALFLKGKYANRL